MPGKGAASIACIANVHHDSAELTRDAESEQLLALIRGFRVSQAISVATRLGIPDLLAESPRAIGDLAEAAGAHARSLGRLLMFRASVGVLDKVGPDRFALTPVAVALRTDVPGSQRSSVLFQLNNSHWRSWGDLLHSVRTGETAFDHVHGKGLFDYLAQNPEVSALFNQGMLGNSPAHAQLIARSYDFAGMKTVIDVGAGRGRLIATILAEHPHLKGVLFDQPDVLPEARTLIEEAAVVQRCELVGGDFFKNAPAGGDASILRNIIHDWQDEEAITILTACRRAMTDGTRLVLVERQLPDDPRAEPSVFLADLEMLVNVSGRERTTEEYAALFGRSGLELAQTISLGGNKDAMGHYLLEARPV